MKKDKEIRCNLFRVKIWVQHMKAYITRIEQEIKFAEARKCRQN